MDFEEWRDVPGFEGLYKVSNNGQVRSEDRVIPHNCGKWSRSVKGRILKQVLSKQTNYYTVMLSKNGKPRCHTVHSLVAAAFLEKTDSKQVVDHIDGNRQNNILSNLRYVSSKENANNPNTKDNMNMWETGHTPWNKGIKWKRKKNRPIY